MKNRFLPFFLLLSFLMITDTTIAQYSLKNEQSYLKINGKATQHKWSADAKQISGSLNAQVKDNKLIDITHLEVSVQSKQLKSGKSGMDERMYKALKADNHPKITYKNKSEKIEGNKITLSGELSISGVTKTINTTADYKIVDGKISINGIFTIKMTDYNIDPPTFMFGTLKTGDDVIIKFSLIFQ